MPNRDGFWGEVLQYHITAGLSRYLNGIWAVEAELGSMEKLKRQINRQINDVDEQKVDV